MALQKFLKDAKRIEDEFKARRRQDRDGGKRGGGAHDDESNWLVSYADMMTLLCGFFIMLFSMAKLDDAKYEKAKAAIAEQFHGKYEKPASAELARFVTQVLQEAGVERETSVRFDPLGVAVVFQSSVFFDTLSAEVKPQGAGVLTRLIDSLVARERKDGKQYRVVVEGHTDSRPVIGGTFASNWELSGARATRVLRMFLERGIAPDHGLAIAYGDTQPAAPARTPAGTWDEAALARNRRVVVRILEPTVEAVPIAGVATVPAVPPSVAATAPSAPRIPAATSPAQAAAPAQAPATSPARTSASPAKSAGAVNR